eukprot:gnl/TRDRNA2_/TRDRNA2_39406_c0_seq1.p1 gnl/TRDRNA2_/TRDRNA2_39406_c0~~gnl/TRDRNA2_/TRDRNA2_39406_c0_seq1.p1  ORF type:complete len:337 (-),score=25.20 gnl/TRDRNA2_/TRDRNA2_39406_c0_seq1:51-1061(-)
MTLSTLSNVRLVGFARTCSSRHGVFGCRRYGLALCSACGVSTTVCFAWQILKSSFMGAHFSLSWHNVSVHGHWWTLWTSHFSHQDVEHHACNTFLFAFFGWCLQGVLPVAWLVGAFFMAVPFATSALSMSAVYYLYGPTEAKDLSRRYPGLKWDKFCYLRWMELESGLNPPLTPHLCGFKELGIPNETTVPVGGYDAPTLVARCKEYEVWQEEAYQGKIGMSGLVNSFAGFGAAWLLHLGLSGVRHPAICVGLIALVAPSVAEISGLMGSNPGVKRDQEDSNEIGHFPSLAEIERLRGAARPDTIGHFSGFAAGVFVYMFRQKQLATIVLPPFVRK